MKESSLVSLRGAPILPQYEIVGGLRPMQFLAPLVVSFGVLMSATPAFAESYTEAAPVVEVPRMAPNAVEFRLDNGMQVVVIPDHRAPVVTHMVWYRVGAADETAGQSGIAHFLEHLMFKGTEAHPNDEFRNRVAAIGGDENAFTSSDYTAYFQRVAKENLGEMMAFEADRMINLLLSDKVVATERDVVLNERRDRIERNPDAVLTST
jgi:zinc protease